MVGPIPEEEIATMGASERKKSELTEQLQMLRGEMSGDLENLGVRLNVVQRFQNSFARNQKKWLIGGVIVGAALVFSSPRRGSSKKGAGIGNSLMKNLFLGLLTKTTKQIIRQSVPSIAMYLQNKIEQRVFSESTDPREIDREYKSDNSENF